MGREAVRSRCEAPPREGERGTVSEWVLAPQSGRPRVKVRGAPGRPGRGCLSPRLPGSERPWQRGLCGHAAVEPGEQRPEFKVSQAQVHGCTLPPQGLRREALSLFLRCKMDISSEGFSFVIEDVSTPTA